MDDTNKKLRLLTSSRLKDCRACQRLHDIKYAKGYRAVADVQALRFGTLVHLGLQAWWEARRDGRDALEAALAAVQGEADEFDHVRAEELLRGYHFRWTDEPYEVLGVEVEFETELRNPATKAASRTWRLAGKIDVLVQHIPTGKAFLIEHKTSSEDIAPGSAYWKRLRMDGQVSIYFEGSRSLGVDVAGCVYDVLGKPGIKPLRATPIENRKLKKDGTPYANIRMEDETPEEFRARYIEAIAEDPARFFQRGEVVRLDSEMEEALFDVWQLGQQIRESELASRAPRNPDACQRWGRTCEFFEVCSGAASLEDPALFTQSTDIHPELSKEERTNEQHASSP